MRAWITIFKVKVTGKGSFFFFNLKKEKRLFCIFRTAKLFAAKLCTVVHLHKPLSYETWKTCKLSSTSRSNWGLNPLCLSTLHLPNHSNVCYQTWPSSTCPAPCCPPKMCQSGLPALVHYQLVTYAYFHSLYLQCFTASFLTCWFHSRPVEVGEGGYVAVTNLIPSIKMGRRSSE